MTTSTLTQALYLPRPATVSPASQGMPAIRT